MRHHPTTTDELLDRLRKIEGQVRGIQHMIDRRERCTDVLTQIAAARAALGAVGLGLLDAQLRTTLAADTTDPVAVADAAVDAVELLVR
jgi:DNA-binding FrmR family transcriptional regulator